MILGLLRVKNEARWIERCVGSILPLCDRVIVLDDHSTDDTREICASLEKTSVIVSPFSGTDEARDKNFLLNIAMHSHPEWIVFIDGDEMLAPGALEIVRAAMTPEATCLSLRILYLWNAEDLVRTDRVYGDFHRESIFRPNGSKFSVAAGGANFHCGNVPMEARRGRRVLNAPLLHFGYLHREDRERKYSFYNQKDPDNGLEDRYRHVVIGDLFPAESSFTHAGPLRLEPLSKFLPQ